MKFENKYIKIKTKKQEIIVHNYIYDEYLSLFSKAQYALFEYNAYEPITAEIAFNANYNKEFTYCYMKFENELTNIQNAETQDFNISVKISNKNITGNECSITADYEVIIQDFFYDGISGTSLKLNSFADKKITALGFGNNRKIFACVDLSNYQIVIKENEPLSIFRRDIAITDGVVDGIDFPLHIAPFSNIFEEHEANGTKEYSPIWATLYSVGFGNVRGSIQEEFIINDDIKVIKKNDKEFSFKLNKKFGNTYYPSASIYPASKYPLAEYAKKEISPGVNIYAGNQKYPLYGNFKYIIYKYRLYYMYRDLTTANAKARFLNKYYTLSYYEEKVKGVFEIKTKIERR